MEMLTVSQAAKSLGVTPALIRIYIRNNLFPGAEKVRGTRWQIPRAAVELFDGTEVAGSFSKQPKKEPDPFCIVEEMNGEFCCVLPTGVCVEMDNSSKVATGKAKILNDAAAQWVKENYGS